MVKDQEWVSLSAEAPYTGQMTHVSHVVPGERVVLWDYIQDSEGGGWKWEATDECTVLSNKPYIDDDGDLALNARKQNPTLSREVKFPLKLKEFGISTPGELYLSFGKRLTKKLPQSVVAAADLQF